MAVVVSTSFDVVKVAVADTAVAGNTVVVVYVVVALVVDVHHYSFYLC